MEYVFQAPKEYHKFEMPDLYHEVEEPVVSYHGKCYSLFLCVI